MIHFFIKFLICFTKPKPPVKKEKVNRRESKGPKKKDKTKGVNEHKQSQLSDPKEIMETDDSVIEFKEETREWCHIEYCLLESVFPNVEINVVTWGAAAKIYTQDDCRAIKTVEFDDLVWVYFVMVHKIRKLENSEVLKLKDSTVTFTFSQAPAKMMASAANDWPKQFIIRKKMTGSSITKEKWFFELYQTDPPEKYHEGDIEERVDNYKLTRPDRNSIVSLLQVTSSSPTIEKKIEEITNSLAVMTDSLIVPLQTKNENKLKKNVKNKNNEKRKSILDEKVVLSLKAELLLAKKYDVCAEQKAVSPGLRYVGVFANASKIMTDEQDQTFLPLTVTIEGVENLPMNFLKTFNLKNIYARYDLGTVLHNVETTATLLTGKDVQLNDTRLFFISSTEESELSVEIMQRQSVFRLTEALMTRRLVVKLYGEKESVAEPTVEPCLFGQRATDEFISTPGHEMFLTYEPPQTEPKEVFLGSACFSLLELVKGYLGIHTSSVLTSLPVSTWDPACDLEDLIDMNSSKDARKVILSQFSTRGCIPDSVLLENCTSIQLTVAIGYPLTNFNERQLMFMTDIYHRLVVIFKNRRFANTIIERVANTNFMMSMTSMESFSSFYAEKLHPSSERLQSSKSLVMRIQSLSNVANQIQEMRRKVSAKSITGFYIESEEEFILVLETVPHMISHLIDPLHGFLPGDGRTIYDSTVFFNKRLYEGFYPEQLYKIKLATSLNELLQRSSNYLRKPTPERAVQALLLLDLLRRSQTMSGAAANQLFPTVEQLVSFNRAFGTEEDIYSSVYQDPLSSTSHLF